MNLQPFNNDLLSPIYDSKAASQNQRAIGRSLTAPEAAASQAAFSVLLAPVGITLEGDQHAKWFQAIKSQILNSADIFAKFDEDSITFFHSHAETEMIVNKLAPGTVGKIEHLRNLRPQTSAVIEPKLNLSYETARLYREKIQELIEEAKQSLIEDHANHQFPNAALPPTTDYAHLIDALLTSHQGFCLGELHNEASPKKFLIENMAKLKEQGVEVLFLEHLFFDTTQKWLDQYFAASSNEMPVYLKMYLNHLDAHFHIRNTEYNFTQLVMAAKKHNIKVIAIDTTTSYLCGADRKLGIIDDRERYLAMNYMAENIIKREAADRKFVALIGSGHLTQYEDIPGVADLLSCPSVIVNEVDDIAAPRLAINVTDHHESVKFVSAVVKMAGAAVQP